MGAVREQPWVAPFCGRSAPLATRCSGAADLCWTLKMGCGNSIAVTPEQQLKDEQRRKRKHAKVVSRSELLTLRMVEPKPGAVVEVRMMETVGVLLGRAAIKIGLEEWDGELLTMEYDGNIVDHAEMLKDIGIAQKGEFKVNGYQEAKVESAKRLEIRQAEAKKVDLHKACREGKVAEVELVCKYFPKAVQEVDWDQDTPLHNAARGDNGEVAELLLRAGAALDAKNENDNTPLHVAAVNNKVDVAQVLLGGGAFINALNEHKNTPLHEAAGHNKVGVTKLLLDSRAKPKLLNEGGQSALDLAIKVNPMELSPSPVQLLRVALGMKNK